MRFPLLCLPLFFVAAVGAAVAAPPEVNIANGPLYNGRVNVHPNMVLNLSVEFPTVGIAYRGDNGTYNKTTEYIGYFNPAKCYRYVGGERNVTDGYFAIAKDADVTTHECGGDSFSGNFMNWASSSAIDILRYALTGGDRVVDTADTTILQRAFLREDFYAHATFFPRRTVIGGGNVSTPSQVTPFNVTTLYIVSCRNRILFSDMVGSGGTCDTPAYDSGGKLAATDKRLGEYLVRVKVCDTNESSTRVDLCQQYGSNYKPVGEMQRNAGRIRFAAMGYLLDNAATRYGGVLRAPMKYVGPKKFDQPGFSEAANDKLEWDPATGVFYNNPEAPSDRNNTSANSGVINYLNKFGRSGAYKNLDPVGELYYEAIRYLQGKQPTSEATAGMTEAMKDGFPVITGWTDPVIASCQRNYIVTIADVNTHWDRYIPGNQRTTYNNGVNANDPTRAIEPAVAGKTPELDVKVWTHKVGELEADANGIYGNPSPRPGLANLDMIDTGSGGHGTYYMAGLAYWANTNDIRFDKPVRVKTYAIDVDEGGNGLVDGNTRFGAKPRDSQLYLAAKYGGFNDRNGDGNPFVTFGADGKTVVTKTNTEWDPDGLGVPSNYFLAGQPHALISSIRKIFSDIANASGTTSGVSASGTKVTSDGAYVYQPGFDPAKWSGSLKRLRLTLGEDGTVKIADTADWDAGDILTGNSKHASSPTPDARHIYSAKYKPDNTFVTIEFKWDKLSAEQQALLNTSPADGQNDDLGSKRLDYLRGIRTLERGRVGGIFRTRDRVLGDIVNSNPTYVGAPALNVRGDGYGDFYESYKNRTKAVYVGSNDGMLHAFDAGDGAELFAYVPNALMPKLGLLTSADYVHRPFVDGALAVAEAKVGAQWRTVLAAGFGGGAQGVFALDVTNPSDFAGGLGAMWEFTDADDPDIGNLTAAPVIAKFRTGMSKGVPQYRYFAVVSSGWNNYRSDGDGRFDVDAPGALFLLALDKSATARWEEGVNYYKFKTPIADSKLANGLSAPALVVGSDGAVRYVYAGDLQGNLWRFDFTGVAPWPHVRPSSHPLFTATDANGVRQPITVQPRVVFAPGGGYVVLFGTGKFVEDADAATGNFKPQSFYAILDTTYDANRVTGRSQLAARTATKSASGDAVTISGAEFIYGISSDTKKGWYLDFLDSGKTGERSVTNPLTVYGRLFFNTIIPGTDPCTGGSGRSYALDVLTGLPISGATTGAISTVGLPSSPVLFDAGDTTIGDRDAIGSRSATKKYAVFNFGTGGEKGMVAQAQDGLADIRLPAGRFSWREVVNWQELRRAANK